MGLWDGYPGENAWETAQSVQPAFAPVEPPEPPKSPPWVPAPPVQKLPDSTAEPYAAPSQPAQRQPSNNGKPLPLVLRYNNPGAMEYAPWQAKYGATVGPNGRYAQFPDPASGYKAMEGLLGTYRSKHGLNTVAGIVNRWAPPNVDNNSTARVWPKRWLPMRRVARCRAMVRRLPCPPARLPRPLPHGVNL
jgi:hypothetical protein